MLPICLHQESNQNKKKYIFLGCISIIKEGRRRRYIAFKISPSNINFDKSSIIHSVNLICKKDFDKSIKEMGLFVISYNDGQGIIRCRHTDKEQTISLLKSIIKIDDYEVEVDTIATSGTIKALVRKYMDK